MKQAVITINGLIVLFFIFVALTPNHYTFIIWNLLLALIPYNLSVVLQVINHRILTSVVAITWLLFYPNTMYMITDYVHLTSIGTGLGTIDQFFNYAVLSVGILLGVLLGLASAQLVAKRFFPDNALTQIVFYGVLSVLSAFGIYLGRFLRLNSWDFLTDFFGTMQTIVASITEHSFAFVVLFGALQWVLLTAYQTLRQQ